MRLESPLPARRPLAESASATLPVMGISAPVKPVSIEEYLSNPAYEHCEYVHGEVVPLNVGTRSHSRIQIKCGRKLDEYFDAHPGGYVGAELHCRLLIKNRPCYRLPDVAVVVPDRSQDSAYLEGAPDLVVEIKSPEDKVTALFDKIDEYFSNGARLAWLVLPEEQSVLVLTPNAFPRGFGLESTLDGGDLLPGFSVAVKELFA